jgi:hypothetical protein
MPSSADTCDRELLNSAIIKAGDPPDGGDLGDRKLLRTATLVVTYIPRSTTYNSEVWARVGRVS